MLRAMKREMPETAVVSFIPFEKTPRNLLEEGALAYVVRPLSDLSFGPARTKLIETFPEAADARA
jgi:hypothetical protein